MGTIALNQMANEPSIGSTCRFPAFHGNMQSHLTRGHLLAQMHQSAPLCGSNWQIAMRFAARGARNRWLEFRQQSFGKHVYFISREPDWQISPS